MARKRNQKEWDEGKAIATARRKAHFANGGTLASWRGRPATFADRKARADKRACREHIRMEG